MNIVITMAGKGSRFRIAGHECPKYEIEVNGRSLFEWSMHSLEPFIRANSHFTFICLAENSPRETVMRYASKLGIVNLDIVELNGVTDGQATTVLAAEEWLAKREGGLLIYNIDTHIDPAALDYLLHASTPSIPCFSAVGDHWSFVATDECGFAVRTAEKVRISERASIGLYTFSDFEQFKRAYRATFASGNGGARERYIAPIYNALIHEGVSITAPMLPRECIVPLGTPDELQRFARKGA